MIGAWAGTGLISGTGGITKDGAGTLNFAGWSIANTYTGPTYVKNGTLLLGRVSVPSISGPGTLTIGDGSGSAGSAVVRYAGADQIGSVPVVIDSDGLLDLAGNSETIDGSLTLNYGGDITLGTATLTLGGNVSVSGGSFASYITGPSGALNLAATRSFDVAASASLHLQVPVTGTGGITKTGSGWLRFYYPNTYSGLTVVQAGTLSVESYSTLGTTNSGTVISNSASIWLRSGLSVTNEALTLHGPGQGYGALVVPDSGPVTWAGPITFAADGVVYVGQIDSTLLVSGVINGPGGVTKTGDGTLTYAGNNNSYAGTTRVNSGTLLLDTWTYNSAFGGPLVIGDGEGTNATVRLLIDTEIPDNVPITINNGGLLDLNSWNETIGNSLTLNGGDVTLDTGTLTLAGNVSVLSSSSVINGPSGALNLSATRTFDVASGVMFDLQAPVTGAGGITKTGNGILRPDYPNTYAGLTVVQAGFVEMWTATALGASTSGTVVSNGATLQFRAGLVITNEALTLYGPGFPGYGTLRMWQSGTSSWTGPITLATDSVILVDNAAGLIEVSGSISGPGGVTKTGGGTLILSGSADNTYSGGTVVKEGILELNKTGDRWAITYGTLRIGDGVGGERADVVRYLGGTDQLNENVPIVITNSGLLELNGHNDTVGPITFSGGKITLGTGTLTLGGNVTVLDSYPVIEGPSGAVSLPATRTFDVKTGVLDIYAPVTGPGGLTKAGGGTMLLYYNDTYSGLTTVQGGYLLVGAAQSLGTTNNGTVVSNNATLSIFNIAAVFNEPLTLNGGAYAALLMRGAKTSYWAGPITLNADSVIESDDPIGSLHVTSAIGGTGGLTISGPGTLVLEGTSANTYAGTSTVQYGTLVLAKPASTIAVPGNLVLSGADCVVRLGGSQQIADTADILVNSGGLFDFGAFFESVDTLRGSGTVSFGTNGWIYVGLNNGTSTFEGQFTGVGYASGWTVGKTGSGTFTINGNNTFSAGNITIQGAGKIVINGAQPQAPVLLYSPATLAGTGTVGHVTANGRLWPGASPGILTVSNVTFTGTGDYYVELNGTVPGSGFDQIKARGTVSLGNASLSATLGFPSAISNSFTIIDNDGSDAVTGTFAGLAEAATANVSGTPFRITYIGGTGNDVVLTQLTTTQRPLLKIAPANVTNVVLWWPTNFTGYTLDANTNLNTNAWSVVSPAPVVVGTNNFVTNAASGSKNYYRLRIP